MAHRLASGCAPVVLLPLGRMERPNAVSSGLPLACPPWTTTTAWTRTQRSVPARRSWAGWGCCAWLRRRRDRRGPSLRGLFPRCPSSVLACPPPLPPHPKLSPTITRRPMTTRKAAGSTRPRRSTTAATPTHLRLIPRRAPSRRLAVDQLSVPFGLAGGLGASLPSSDSTCLSASLRPH